MTSKSLDNMTVGYVSTSKSGEKVFIPDSAMAFGEQENLSLDEVIALELNKCNHTHQRWGHWKKNWRPKGQNVGTFVWEDKTYPGEKVGDDRTCEDCGQILVGQDALPKNANG